MNTSAYTDTTLPNKVQFSCAEIHEIIKQTAEPLAMQEATERAVKTIDLNFKASDHAKQLDDKQRQSFLFSSKILRMSSTIHLESGKLNKLNPDAKPVSSRYYPVLHINKETFKKELFSYHT